MRLSLLLVLVTGLAACSSATRIATLTSQTALAADTAILLEEVPFYPQEAYQCGPAALATVLNYSGAKVDVGEMVNKVYLPARQGSLQPELLAATRSVGRIPYLIESSLPALLREVHQGRPVLVFQNLGLSWLPQWHFAVVVGFDLYEGSITLRSGTVRNYTISLALFEKTWRRAGNWGFVALEPGDLPAAADAHRYLEALVAMEQSASPESLLAAYQAGISRWPELPSFGLGLGNLFYRQGELQLAGDQYELVARHHPRSAEAHNNLAQVLLELGQPDLAVTHATEAIRLGGPHAATYRRTLEQIHEKRVTSP